MRHSNKYIGSNVTCRRSQKRGQAGHFASTSEFFRHLLRLWNTERMARQIEKAEKRF